MTIGDDGIASICMGKEHEGSPCVRCGHTAEAESRSTEETATELARAIAPHMGIQTVRIRLLLIELAEQIKREAIEP